VNEWKVIFATVIIFGAGVISGGLLVNYADLSHERPIPPAALPLESTNSAPAPAANHSNKTALGSKLRLPEILSKQFVDRLEAELQLTLGQRADIEKIIADSQDEMRKAVQDVRQDARLKIREKLSPEQRKRFDDLFKARHDFKKSGSGTNAPSANPLTLPATNGLPSV
jgi:Spy/CpxP family protein refolding chaperone